jgi:hypothetical protein
MCGTAAYRRFQSAGANNDIGPTLAYLFQAGPAMVGAASTLRAAITLLQILNDFFTF